jgi:hypothetical protein
MKKWTFAISYKTRAIVIEGEATVVGSYSDSSKPLAMVRTALAKATEEPGVMRVTLVSSNDGLKP